MKRIALSLLVGLGLVGGLSQAPAQTPHPVLPPTTVTPAIPPSAGELPPDLPNGVVGADEDMIPVPDREAAARDGFTLILVGERLSDERTKIIRKEFMIPLEAAVGEDGKNIFEWALIDLTGDGYADLVVKSLAPGLRDAHPGIEGIRTFVFSFDGRTWNRILDATAQEVAYRDRVEDGLDIHELALIQPKGYILYRLEGGKYVKVDVIKE